MYSTASAPCDMPISVIHCSACTRRTVPTLCAMFYLSETTWTARLIIPTDTFELTLKYIPIPFQCIFVKRQVFVDVGSPLEMAASIVIKAHTANHLELIEQVRTMSLDSGYNHSTRADMFVRRFIAGGEQGLPAFVASHAYTRIWSQPFHWFASFFSHTHTHLIFSPYNINDDGHALGWMDACPVPAGTHGSNIWQLYTAKDVFGYETFESALTCSHAAKDGPVRPHARSDVCWPANVSGRRCDSAAVV
jgi:hypothetical protein